MSSHRPSSLRFLAVAGCIVSLGLAACSDESSSSGTSTTSSVVTTSSVEPSSTSSSSTSTSTTAPATTSTTMPVILGLGLSADGLGDALFGAGVDGVMGYVTSILGDPTADSGWIDPAAAGAACPGTEIRLVTWNDLSLMFSDDSPAASGFRHFASYRYGPKFGPTIDPYGLETEGGIGVGDTVGDLRTVYPSAIINPEDELSGPSFYIEEGLIGFITGVSDTDQVASFVGGYDCGE